MLNQTRDTPYDKEENTVTVLTQQDMASSPPALVPPRHVRDLHQHLNHWLMIQYFARENMLKQRTGDADALFEFLNDNGCDL